MRASRFCAISLVALAALACEKKAPGGENLRRARELLATKPEAALEQYEKARLAGANSNEVKKGRASALEELEEYDDAEKLLTEVLSASPEDLDARLAMARIKIVTKRTEEARGQLEKTLGHQPPHIPALLLFAALADTRARAEAGLAALDALTEKHYEPLRKSAEYAAARANLQNSLVGAAAMEKTLTEAKNSSSLGGGLALAVARTYRGLGKHRIAEWLLVRASESDESADEVHQELAELALELQHLSVAETAIAKLRTEFKPDPKALLLQARLLEMRGNSDESLRATARARDTMPADEQDERRRVTLLHVQRLLKRGKTAEAKKELVELLSGSPGYPPAKLVLASIYVRQKKPDEAIEQARPLLENDVTRIDAYQLLIAAQLLKKDIAGAEGSARRLVDESKSDPRAVVVLAKVLKERSAQEALAVIEAGLAQHPRNLRLANARIALSNSVGGFSRAEKVAKQLAATANSPEIDLLLAKLYAEHQKLDEAIAVYERIVRERPRALLDLSVLQERAGRLAKAAESVRQLTQTAPYDTVALMRLGVLEDRIGNYDGARQAYTRVLNIEPNSVIALNNLAMLLAATKGEEKRGIDLARKAHAISPKAPSIIDTLGWVLTRSDDVADRQEAVQLLRHSSGRLRTPQSYYHYGIALMAAGQRGKARQELERALRQKGAFAERADAERRLAELDKPDAGAAPR
jgi:tetratricopeptide (TPR) repeat protein